VDIVYLSTNTSLCEVEERIRRYSDYPYMDSFAQNNRAISERGILWPQCKCVGVVEVRSATPKLIHPRPKCTLLHPSEYKIED
jgi:hypothetical protein